MNAASGGPMRVCLVLYDPQPFGGLEEYATILAVELQEQGHPVSVLSTTWAAPDNQYIRRLRERGVTVTQPPRWLSYLASDWSTKERVVSALTRLSAPLVYALAPVQALVTRRSLQRSIVSTRNWCRQCWMQLAAPDRRPALGTLLLEWWRLRWHPDLLHVQGYTSTLLFAVDWAHGKGVPVVYEEHQTPDPHFDWWRDSPRSLNKAAVVVAVSHASAEGLRSVCQVTQPIVVRNPLLPDPAVGGLVPRTTRPSSEPVRITTVARLVEAKGIEYLLDAMAILGTLHPAARLRVYGEGPLRADLVARANRMGLDGKAIFTGVFTSRDELARIMADTDVFAVPSLLEGNPFSVLEAMAYGCPIVATRVGGIGELITDGVSGLLCDARDAAALATRLDTLIRDRDLRVRLGRAARAAFERSPCQPASVCAEFVAVYRQALQGTAAC